VWPLSCKEVFNLLPMSPELPVIRIFIDIK